MNRKYRIPGLMLYRNRFYHVGLERFVTKYPIIYEGRDVNLYRYVKNKVIIFLDMLGFTEIKGQGCPYYFHPNDADPFPSKPHVHKGCPNSPIKVNLCTGEIFDNTRPTGKKKIPKNFRYNLECYRKEWQIL
jgi:RHS repeat-associated protein